jgi:hypothetical protein
VSITASIVGTGYVRTSVVDRDGVAIHVTSGCVRGLWGWLPWYWFKASGYPDLQDMDV